MAYNNVPANGWPQIKKLEELDAIAQQIADMPTFTSNDKAFLADLPAYPVTDGTKVLAATTSSGSTSLSYEEIPEELPADPQTDGIRVLTATTTSGETVKSWEDSEVGGVDYSTAEQDTGRKWINGETIYQKTIVVDNPVSTGTATSVAHGITNFGSLIDFKAISSMGNAHISGNTFAGSNNYYSSILINKTNVQYEMKWGSEVFTKLTVTIYYTKVTT